MHKAGLITKESLIMTIRRGWKIYVQERGYIDPSKGAGLSGMAFSWIFELVFKPDIMRVLSSKDYGDYGVDLLKDLNMYLPESPRGFNERMIERLKIIMESLFGTEDLSIIYKLLNSGAL